MKNLPGVFVWRTVRAILFIGVVVILCTAVSGAGLFLASRFHLTRSKDQVPLTALSIGQEGPVKLPRRGKTEEGNGWKLRNSGGIYTLILDNAVIDGSGTEEKPQPAIYVSGDLTIELKPGSGNRIHSDHVGIRSDSGTLTMEGEGSLEIRAGQIGIDASDVRLSGSRSLIEAENTDGIGIRASSLIIDPSVGQVTVRGNASAVIAASPEPDVPRLQVTDTVKMTPRSMGIKEFKSTHTGSGTNGQTKGSFNVKTFSQESAVAYDEATGCFRGSAREVTFTGGTPGK